MGLTAIGAWWEARRDRGFQAELARTREPIDRGEFMYRLAQQGADEQVAGFVWDQAKDYYRPPLTPYPSDRPISEFRIDPEDLDDWMLLFEKQFGRHWTGTQLATDDPTLAEYAVGLVANTVKP